MENTSDISNMIEQIKHHLEQDVINERDLKTLEISIQSMPFNCALSQLLGELYFKISRIDRGISLYTRVAEYYREQNDLEQSLAAYQHILDVDQNHLDSLEQVANLYLQKHLYELAAIEYRKLSRRYQVMGDIERAIEFRKSVLLVEPENIVQHVKTGELCLQIKAINEAVELFERAIELLEEKGYWNDLLKVAERLLYVAPQHLQTLKLCARVYLENNDALKAIVKLRKSLHLAPRDPEVLKLLVIAFDKIEQPDKTLSVLQKLAEVYRERKQFDLARDVYTEILQRDPKDQISRESLDELQAYLPISLHRAITPIPASRSLMNDFRSSEYNFAPVMALTNRSYDEIRGQLAYANFDPERASNELLDKILNRNAPYNRNLASWPQVVRDLTGGELLYRDRYLLTDVMRQDAFARTFRAIDLQHPSHYVGIQLPYFLDQQSPIEREWLNQMEKIADRFTELSHPHLLSIHAFGLTERGRPYLLTEYFEGSSLTNLQEPITPIQLFDLFYQIVHTLEYLHSVGLAHGALAPGYILLNRMGELKIDGVQLPSLTALLAEYMSMQAIEGLASAPNTQPPSFALPKYRGTPGFIAPELLLGASPDRPADVFSVGCLLYFMARRERPPWSTTRQIGDILYTRVSRSQDDPIPTLALGDAPHIQFIENLMHKMLEYDPEQRITLYEAQNRYLEFIENEYQPIMDITERRSSSRIPLPSVAISGAKPQTSAKTFSSILPEACHILPKELQGEIEDLLKRIEQIPWFRPQVEPQDALELLEEHIHRLSPFIDTAIPTKISYVRTSWQMLDANIAPQKDLEVLTKQAAEESLMRNANAWSLAGKAAWDAIHNFPQDLLIPFDVASAAVSSAAWSVTWNPTWAEARTNAWNTAKNQAKAMDRMDAWNAVKTAAWTTSWPNAKAASHSTIQSVARIAAGDISWHTAWLVASDQMDNYINPFESLFKIWEMGLYPMLLFNGDYVIIAIDPKSKEPFCIIKN